MRCLDHHLERLRTCFAGLPDPRRGDNRRYTMADMGMAALSVFLMQSPSFLAHQRALAETPWRQARRRLGTRYHLFEHPRTITEYQVFPDWNALMVVLATGGPAAQPP